MIAVLGGAGGGRLAGSGGFRRSALRDANDLETHEAAHRVLSKHAMPSFSHEGLVRLFSDRPSLAIELLRDVAGIDVPAHDRARIASADLTDVQPASRYADVVVLAEDQRPVLGLVVEVQLDVDEDKKMSWPMYLANLRGRLRCPVELLVVSLDERVARWAARPIALGQGFIRPVVLGPGRVPALTDLEDAEESPELAVLSSLAHGRGPVERAVAVAHAALTACARYPDERALLYSDLVMAALGDAVRTALEDLMRNEGYEYQSEFAKRHRAEGKAEGIAEGKAEGIAEGEARGEARALLTVLEARGLSVSDEQRDRILSSTDLAELERWLRKAATVSRTDELFA